MIGLTNMPKLILYTRWKIRDDGSFVVVKEISQEYGGVWEECKKGRETLEQNMKADQEMAKSARERSAQQYGTVRGLQEEMTGSSTPGSLTPAATAQLAADRDNIARTYNGMRQTAFRTLGQRGVGSAPSGFGLAEQNALNVGQEGSETGAYRNAQVQTQNQRNRVLSSAEGQTGTQGNLGNTASGESTSAAVARNKAGSTFGDIMGGIASAAPIIAAPFTGGASLLAGGMNFSNPFSKMGSKGSGVGSYGPSTGVPGAPYS